MSQEFLFIQYYYFLKSYYAQDPNFTIVDQKYDVELNQKAPIHHDWSKLESKKINKENLITKNIKIKILEYSVFWKNFK